MSRSWHAGRCIFCKTKKYQCFLPSLGVAALVGVLRQGERSMATSTSVADLSWIGACTPCYGINGRQVTVIHEPSAFFETLKKKAETAQERIVLASLYLGTGHLEQELVTSIATACENANKNNRKLTVDIILDHQRATRGSQNSRKMLLPLLAKYGDMVNVHLFHSPDLRGLLKRCMPERLNETVSVFHLKVYLFDNSIILSGANLSDSYFTNRQDRYIMIDSAPYLTDFFAKLVSIMSSISFKLTPTDHAELRDRKCIHPFEGDYKLFRDNASRKVQELIMTEMDSGHCKDMIECHVGHVDTADEQEVDTWIYPLLQMAPLGVDHDNEITQKLWTLAPKGGRFNLASGYFNLTEQYSFTIVQLSKAYFSILSASPEANGFYGAGLSGYIPILYTQVTKQFCQKVLKHGQQSRIQVQEYRRDNWTFHGKGLWYYGPGDRLPVLSCIGSPNYGYRSVYRDIEAQVVIVTNNKALREQLHQEQLRLYNRAYTVDQATFECPKRRVPVWVRTVTRFIRTFF